MNMIFVCDNINLSIENKLHIYFCFINIINNSINRLIVKNAIETKDN
jgi:hypothetical protein